MTISVGGRVSIIGIYYTIFSKLLCSNPPLPREESHMQIYSESTAYYSTFAKVCITLQQSKLFINIIQYLFSNSQLWTKTTFAQSNEGKYSTILTLWCSSQGWNFISACTLILTQLGQAGQNSTWAENTLWNQPLKMKLCQVVPSVQSYSGCEITAMVMVNFNLKGYTFLRQCKCWDFCFYCLNLYQ